MTGRSAIVVAALLASSCSRSNATSDAQQRAAKAANGSAQRAKPLPGPSLSVPRIAASPKLDGELDEAAWHGAARTGPFADANGREARPYSDARLLWDDANLYVALYAADQNIETRGAAHDAPLWLSDAFSIRLASPDVPGTVYAIDVGPSGDVSDARLVAGAADATWESGARVGVDRDGTPNDPSDEDEEWVVEIAIPWSALHVEPRARTRIAIGIRRCDTPKHDARSCGSWGEARDREPTATLELSAEAPRPTAAAAR